jgi:tripartite-type tricarboxylate transporter receptor subunit TctC
MEYFRLMADFKTTPVPYRGNPQLVNDLVAGQIKFGFVGTTGVAPHIRAGRLKGLAVSTRKRSPLLPDLPALAEVGYPDFEFDTYYVLTALAGVPDPIAALPEREVLQALASPELQEKFRAMDITMAGTPGAETKVRIKSDLHKWAKVVEAAGMRVD